jgi:hypothetical protein
MAMESVPGALAGSAAAGSLIAIASEPLASPDPRPIALA